MLNAASVYSTTRAPQSSCRTRLVPSTVDSNIPCRTDTPVSVLANPSTIRAHPQHTARHLFEISKSHARSRRCPSPSASFRLRHNPRIPQRQVSAQGYQCAIPQTAGHLISTFAEDRKLVECVAFLVAAMKGESQDKVVVLVVLQGVTVEMRLKRQFRGRVGICSEIA